MSNKTYIQIKKQFDYILESIDLNVVLVVVLITLCGRIFKLKNGSI